MSIKFHLPDFWSHGPLNLALIDMIKEHPEYLRDGVEIASVYGCFPPRCMERRKKYQRLCR